MKWIEYYQIYLGLKLHFEQSSYSYGKYGPKKISEQSASRSYLLLKSIEGKREDREAFELRLVAIFKHKVRYLTELYTPESETLFTEYKDEISNWSYYLERDIAYLCDEAEGKGLTFKEIFISGNEFRVPFVLTMLERGRINFHTVAALNSIIPFLDKVNPMLFNVMAMEKYSELHVFSKHKIASIVKPYMEKMNVATC